MTEEEKKVFESTKLAVTAESKNISGALTRVLMLTGPKAVQAILLALTDANDRLMKELKIDVKIDIEGEK